ncbi:unnamed protein product [Orchesella dallaii]|uniref:Dynein heavy chain 2, axonemal n=1 Tax=Orchesella dallaii TaxID=48710 RepID=A0ABP1QS48_9HEXA
MSLETLVEKNEDKFFLLLKQIVAFCITWSVFGIVNAESRLKASAFLKDLDPQVFPTKRTVFDYFVDIQSQKWVKWEDLMEAHLANVPRVIVHTVDTFRIEYLMRQFNHNLYPVLLTGYSSAGKTKLIKSAFKPSQKFTNIFLHIQMTPLMKAKWVQSLIETRLELVSSFVMSPPRGKSLAVFIDDLHVSQNVSKYSQHNEFLRHFVENHLWYDQYVGNPIAVSNVSIIAAMKLNQTQPHNIGIPSRLLSKFAVLYLPKPDEFQLRRIFTAILNDKLNEFPPSVKLLADGITVVTLEVFKLISNQLLPIPTQPLHTFDLQDISRVYDGLLRSDKGIQDTKLCFLRHWFHECNRVFYDRLMDASSRQKFRSILAEQLLKHFEKTVESLFPPGSFSVFGNFMSTQKFYEEIRDEVAIKKLLETVDAKLYKTMRMSFRSTVLFRQAMFQVAKIARAISVSKGHSIVFGEDGQGRQTLTRLCATLYGYKILELPATTKDAYVNHSVALLSLLKEAYYICICENAGCCIILKDDNISRDTLELVSLVISTVDIPNLYTARELQEIQQKLLKSAPAGFKDDPISVYELFRQRVERNFHLILCMNPNAKDFRSYISTYGNILRDMTINWFDIWTRESFLEVAKHLLPSPSILNQDDPIYSGSIFHSFHSIASQISINVTENDFGKFSFVTPIHFIDFVEQYNRLTNDKGSSTNEKIKSFRLAIKEINGVQEKIDYLTEQASTCDSKAQLSREECEAYHKILEEQSSDTEEQAQLVKEKSGELGTEVKEYQELADVIKDEWTGALEAFEQSNSILQDLAEDDLIHIRSYYSPPPIVSKVLDSVMIMIDREPTWPEAKIQLGHPDFIRNIMEFDKARITQEKLSKIRKYIQNTEFTPEAVVKHSNGARILCTWIHAIEKYGRTYLTKIAPKRIKLEESESSIGEKRNALDLQTQKLQILRENLTEIQALYETKQQLKEDSEIAFENANAVLGRAASVLRLLEDDLLKWEEEIGELETKLENLPGDALLAAAYLTYLGSFSFEFRKELKERWLLEIRSRNETRTVLKLSSEWDLENFLGAQLQSLKAAKDLPLSQNEKFIEENIFLLVNSRRLVLAIDPYDIIPLIDNDSEAIVHKVQSDDASILDAYQNYLDSELGNISSQQVVFTSHSDGEYGPTIASRFTIVNFIITLDELRNHFTSKLSGKIHPELKVSRRELLQNLLDEKRQIEELKQNILRFFIRSMFKQQRFQFALLLCIKFLYANNELDLAQLELLAKVNSKVEERAEEDGNNEEEWLTLSSSQFQKLLILENLPKFQGLLQSMREHPNAWQVWLKYFEPENKIPDVWPVELNSYEKLILLSILRPDRLPSQIKSFTTEVLGKELADCINISLIDLQQIHSETCCITPVLFLLDEHGSPDPLNSISTLCSSLKPSPKFYSLTISKQNSHLAKKLFDEGVEEGHWIYFSNCHCALAFISELAMRMEELKLKLINETEKQKQIIHPSFRLWLSLKGRPATEFPLELLRHSIKIAVEQSQVRLRLTNWILA